MKKRNFWKGKRGVLLYGWMTGFNHPGFLFTGFPGGIPTILIIQQTNVQKAV
jgi:hypothetical protein